MMINLQEPLFQQAQVLALVPRLGEKTLRNWNDLGILDPDRVEGERNLRYTPLGVIMLTLMVKLVEVGILPTPARDIADRIALHAIELHANWPNVELRDGRLGWWFDGNATRQLHRAYVCRTTDGGEWTDYYDVRIEAGDLSDFALSIWPEVSIMVQVDVLILTVLNRIYGLIAELKANPPPLSIAKQKPWETEGISERTWYHRKRKERVAAEKGKKRK